MSRVTTLRRCVPAVVVAVASVGCVSDGEPGADEREARATVPIASVTVPPERLTPFCQAMIDLGDRLETDPPDDVGALIIETYEGIVDEVPPEIANEFDAVLTSLRAGTDPDAPGASSPATTGSDSTGPDSTGPVSTEGDPFFEEGYLPDDDPSRRVNAYVQFACRDTANNPGPPATQPLDDIVVDDTATDATSP